MLFRPSFCANCGEKIERSDWHLWTSRRFCDLCVTEMPVQEYGPKILVGFAFLASVVGFSNFLRNGSSGSETTLARQHLVDNSNVSTRRVVSPQAMAPADQIVATTNTAAIQPAPRSLAALPPPPKPGATVKAVVDEMYFCGAQTKKGTPCSRRVKGNVRCFQHQGMPSMVAGDKLRVG